ncbi:MAG: nuclear transport factor 2 family protein [Candidatus Marinimicrobia bacterium]|nr:nuclear transport factor 2 family protein [Candidatus Neomarinimicrobiota bacterium]
MAEKEISTPQKLKALSVAHVRELWSKTYNTEGKPDWSHIFPYYHEDIVFQDSIQKVEGKEAFLGVCNRLTTRCESLNMEIVSIARNGNVFIFDWIMTMSFKKYPSTPMYGASKLTLNAEGLIVQQRDYYDMWGDIFNNIPHWNKIYRRFLKRKFG